jgi:hypothetical protein
VTAGTVNCDGAVIVRAEHSGQDTVIADIVRMVEMAQVRGHLGCANTFTCKVMPGQLGRSCVLGTSSMGAPSQLCTVRFDLQHILHKFNNRVGVFSMARSDLLSLATLSQARTAPIQRLADTVAGKFAYGVMALSAATFAFWATVGTQMFPQVRI